VTAAGRAPASSASTTWAEEATARAWAAGDDLHDLLDLPRRLAVSVASADLGEISSVVDIGSGPGDFLAVALERSASARGLWTDVSPAMEILARTRLGGFGNRVQFVLTDLADMRRAVPAGSADLLVSSRVTHHLGQEALGAFYRDAAAVLRPGGWLANLDHVAVGEPWAGRLRRARSEFAASRPATHRHPHPLPTVEQHLAGLAAAGFTDVALPWRSFWTVLVLAKSRPDRP
jgi:SAM-dependent methyltransferase